MTLADLELVDRPHFPARVCWRCGASAWKGAPLSGCSEKRGVMGLPWVHEYYSPVRDDPFRIPIDADTDSTGWRRMTLTELVEFARYLGHKAKGSFAATVAWTAVRDDSADLWQDPELTPIQYAIALYTEKAEKRARLLGWVLNVIERRLAAGERAEPSPDWPVDHAEGE